MSFLPDNYEPPQADGNYCRLKQGPNKLRILQPPILGYLTWVDKKPIRTRTLEESPVPSKQGDSPKHFWAMPVYNYDVGRVQVWEVTQQTIIVPLTELSRNPDWGDPTMYGITVNKSGEDLNTTYLVTPAPPKALPEEIRQAITDTPVNLEVLFDSGDPFEVSEGLRGDEPPHPANGPDF